MRSSITYLFGSLALLFVLIFVALVIILCSYRKHVFHSSNEANDIKFAMSSNLEIDHEPKILVIMAGYNKPTYIAKPITSSTNCSCENNQSLHHDSCSRKEET